MRVKYIASKSDHQSMSIYAITSEFRFEVEFGLKQVFDPRRQTNHQTFRVPTHPRAEYIYKHTKGGILTSTVISNLEEEAA